MHAAELLITLGRRGHRIGLSEDGLRLVVEPAFDDNNLRECVRASKAEIITLLRALDAPAATAHRFVRMADADTESIRGLGVCLACGIPHAMHGEPPVDTWAEVSDPNDAVLLEAAAIVLVEKGAIIATERPIR